jgi:excisionase family DNA binding protein
MKHGLRRSTAGSGEQQALALQRRLALSIDEAAAARGLSASSIWKWIALGQLRAVKLGGRTLITVEEVNRVLTNGIK